MNGTRLFFRFACGAALGCASMWLAAACGLGDLNGTAPPDASANGDLDAGRDATAHLGMCTTLDASCLGTLPAIWKPVAVASSDAGCAAGFTAQELVTNPTTGAGSCACGECKPVGALSCTGATAIRGGDDCEDDPIANAQPDACTPAHAQHLQGDAPRATGSVNCFAANDAGTGVATDALVACLPTSCAADFCGGASRCVIGEGDLACPSGFTLRAHAGLAADPGCPPCYCEAGAPGTCIGTVTGFTSSTCAAGGAGAVAKTYALGTCNDFGGTDYNAVLVNLVPPPPTCTPVLSTAPIVDASLVAPKTICCQ